MPTEGTRERLGQIRCMQWTQTKGFSIEFHITVGGEEENICTLMKLFNKLLCQ